MRPSLMTRSIVSATAVAGLAIGNLAGAGTSFAGSAPGAPPAVSAEGFGTLATNNLGLTSRQAKDVQLWLRWNHEYTGSIDGLLGTNSWKAMQRHLAEDWEYHDSIDGIPGTNTIKALQRMLRDHGYDRPIDGIAGDATRAAFAKFADIHG
ncbi:peptidoglycan-binding protein [Streptomyces sp. NPDC056452]|uniref:peptidoglycan-binding domain-containing protein n=1 Tax=Streptomyces sp. NPDC056452 TaxID=3345821 RepID=UPI0036841106